jgi:hypothetical protein
MQVSHIHPDGTIEPLGTSRICDCEDPELRIMDADDPADKAADG